MAAAYAALASLMNVIHDLQHHHSPPISLHHQPLDSITQHIIFFLDFLQAYSPDNDDEESSDPLEMRIANAAYEAEDAIESHIVDIIQHSMETINANDEKIKSINLCRDRLQRVIKEMDSIKNIVVDTEEMKKKIVAVLDQVPMKNVYASVSREETTVGLDVASLEIMEKLIGGQSNLQITPIVGMGGIGKTFLAKSIYAKPLIKSHFDICAWATISQRYNTTEILYEILSHDTKLKKEGLSGKSENELGDDLHKFLFGRRFLIVLDDMWSVDAWDKIRRFFPNNENGSRVLVTTRLSQLCSQLNHDYSLHMSFLDKISSWDLFSKTVFGDKRSFPLELKKIGEQIVKNCRGLPLSIVVVGGLLKKAGNTPASWKSILDNLSSMVNMVNDKHCLKLLKMSYNHLPVYLKPCFLYMGVFKEDDRISVSMLIKLWVSEGFLKPSNGEDMETTAREFMQELVDRNLILIHLLGRTGKIKYCKIHDLVRDLCLIEGQKAGLFHVVGKCNQLHPQKMNTLRRVVIPINPSNGNVPDDQLRSMSNVRSVICQCGDGLDVPGNLRLLRTLHDYKLHKKPTESLEVETECYSAGYNMRKLSFPQSLKKLCLRMWKEFEWEEYVLEKIGLLPCLEKLVLDGGWFGKGKWETLEGQFPYLKYLGLLSCKGLKNWTVAEEGSNILPRLEHVSLSDIESLKEIPFELGNIDTLKKIELCSCGDEALVKCVKEMVDEQLKSQGQLCFHVCVMVEEGYKYLCLKSLAGPHFEVNPILINHPWYKDIIEDFKRDNM